VVIYLVISPIQGEEEEDEEKQRRWKKYINNMAVALGAFRPCIKETCTCHDPQMERDFEPFKNGINKEDFDSAKKYGTRYQIIKNRLYREQKCFYPGRCHGIDHFLNLSKQNLPDMEFIVNVRDYPQAPSYRNAVPIFSFSKTADDWDILYPAWSFWDGGPAVMPMYPTGLGRWDLHLDSIVQASKRWPFDRKKDQAFFRGSRTNKVRDPIILWSREEPDLVNASYTKNQAFKDLNDTLGQQPVEPVPFEEHCPYKYLFNFQGQAASFRFRHLFLCGSTVFHVANDYIEFFYPALKPWVHYVPVEADFSNAKDLIEFYQAHPGRAKEIALRGRHMILDHLKMEDVRCYWEKLLKKYASLTTWKPEPDDSLIEIGGSYVHEDL
jgi:protein glucosyltransferase